MRRWGCIIFLIFGIFMLGCVALAEEDYMTDSGKVREIENAGDDEEYMTDSGKIREVEAVGDDEEYMTDSGEIKHVSDSGDLHD